MSHAGNLSPTEAYSVVRDDPSAVLVDVRTTAEWTYVGVPDLSEAQGRLVQLEWNRFGGGHNADFVRELRAERVASDTPLMFLCRSGARSEAAATAATDAGFNDARNIAGGFEGDLNAAAHRGSVAGWKAEGLPWKQS